MKRHVTHSNTWRLAAALALFLEVARLLLIDSKSIWSLKRPPQQKVRLVIDQKVQYFPLCKASMHMEEFEASLLATDWMSSRSSQNPLSNFGHSSQPNPFWPELQTQKTRTPYPLEHVLLLVVWQVFVRNSQYTRTYFTVQQVATCTCINFFFLRLETLKTRIMSSKTLERSPQTPVQANSQSLILTTARQMYRSGGIRAFWPGLVSSGNIWTAVWAHWLNYSIFLQMLGLVGVFPYQAMDLGNYHSAKLWFSKHGVWIDNLTTNIHNRYLWNPQTDISGLYG